MLHHPCILGGNETKEGKIRIGCLTPTFSGPQKGWRKLRHRRKRGGGMLLHHCILEDPQTKTDEIRSAFLTPAFSGAQKSAEMLPHPCILGGP